MDYKEKYEALLEKAREMMNNECSSDQTKTICQEFFPELSENEDERIIRQLQEYVKNRNWMLNGPTQDEVLAWLEKQKESSIDKLRKISTPAEENWFEIQKQWEQEDRVNNDENIREDIIRFFEVEKEDRNSPFFDIAIAYLERQKEQKYIPKFKIGDMLVSTKNPHLTYEILEVGHVNELGNIEYKVEIFTDGKSDHPSNVKSMECCTVDKWGKLIDPRPDIELIQRSWYMEGYHDREFSKEPKWIIKTGEGGPKYELNPKYGQSLAKEQKPAEKLSKEEYVKKFKALCDLYEIKLPNREYDIYHLCKDLHKLFGDADIQQPSEWREEDKRAIDRACVALRAYSNGELPEFLPSELLGYADRLQSLRPQPKQGWSEEDDEVRANRIYLKGYNDAVQNLKFMEWNEEDELNLQNCIAKIEIDMLRWGNNGKTMVDGDKKLIKWLKARRFTKQEWNEEDEKAVHFINEFLEYHEKSDPTAKSCKDWLNNRLKSIRPVKQEWDEEDEMVYQHCKVILHDYGYDDWFKDHCLQPHWKPSNEQLRAFEESLMLMPAAYIENKIILRALYEQLKKL